MSQTLGKTYQSMKNVHDSTDSVYFEALDRIRHDFNRIRQQSNGTSGSTVIATLGSDARPSIHRIELATIMDLGAVFFAYEGNEAHRNIARNPSLAMYISQASPERDIVIEGSVRKLTESESDVAWYRQSQNLRGLRPKEHQPMLLLPVRIIFSNHHPCNQGAEHYAPGPDGCWLKECRTGDYNQVA